MKLSETQTYSWRRVKILWIIIQRPIEVVFASSEIRLLMFYFNPGVIKFLPLDVCHKYIMNLMCSHSVSKKNNFYFNECVIGGFPFLAGQITAVLEPISACNRWRAGESGTWSFACSSPSSPSDLHVFGLRGLSRDAQTLHRKRLVLQSQNLPAGRAWC